MTSKPHDNPAHSFVPEIRQEEERLLAELEKARSEAAQAKAEAERSAEARLAETQKNAPGMVDQIRGQGLKDVQDAIQKEQLTGEQDIIHLESTAQANLSDAVKHILSLVVGVR